MNAIDDVDCIINGIFHGMVPILNRRCTKYHVTVSAYAMVPTTRCIAVLLLMPSTFEQLGEPSFGTIFSRDPNNWESSHQGMSAMSIQVSKDKKYSTRDFRSAMCGKLHLIFYIE